MSSSRLGIVESLMFVPLVCEPVGHPGCHVVAVAVDLQHPPKLGDSHPVHDSAAMPSKSPNISLTLIVIVPALVLTLSVVVIRFIVVSVRDDPEVGRMAIRMVMIQPAS